MAYLASSTHQRATTIRWWLVTIVTALNLVVIGLVAQGLHQRRIQYETLAEVNARNLARLLDEKLSGTFEKVDLTLMNVVEEVSRPGNIRDLRNSTVSAFVKRQLARAPELSEIGVVDSQGVLRNSTDRLPLTAIDVSDREHFVWLSQHPGAGLFISQPLLSRVNRRWSLVIARRISLPDGTFAGIAAALVSLDTINANFSALNVGPNGLVLLRDLQFKILARYTGSGGGATRIGEREAAPEFIQRLQSSPEEGHFHAISPIDGLERSIAYRKIQNYPFYLIVGFAAADYLAEWRRDLARNLALTAAFLVLTVVIAILMMRSWTRTLTQERRFRLLLESSPYPLVAVDGQGTIQFVDQQAVNLLGYAAQELVGNVVEVLLPERYRGGHAALRQAYSQVPKLREMSPDQPLLLRAKNGQEIPVTIKLSPIRSEQGLIVAAAIIDLRERKAAEAQIEFLAFRDPLTGLPNRRLFQERLEHAFVSSARSGRHGALLIVDLDHFKMLNDTLGHDQGDQLLQEAGKRLRKCVQEGDTVARFGGDEFLILLEELGGNAETAANHAERISEGIQSALSQPYSLNGQFYNISSSIGITLFCGDALSVEELMKQADLAMYQAKAAGRNAMRFFDQAMQAKVSTQVEMERELRKALLQQQFSLYCQVQVGTDGTPVGAEALIRWQHPSRGTIAPADFIPVAEDSGLILPIGLWVLETACTTLTEWAEDPRTAKLTLAVNVSAKQLHQANFVEQVKGILSRTNADPRMLKLELTESHLVSDVENTIAKMAALKAIGVGFCLDDFGTGYSSLTYLKRLPLDQLKIDQSFTRDMLTDPNDAAIAKMVIALAWSLGLPALAEGVETAAQRDFLALHGCHLYQGYLYGRPMPIEEFERLVTQ